MSIFLNAQSQLRSGWKIAAFIAILLPVWIGTGFVLQLGAALLLGPLDEFQIIALNVLISLIPAVVATLFAAQIVERLPLLAFGIGFHDGWRFNAAIGGMVAVYLLALQMLGSLLFGHVRIVWTAGQNSFGRLLLTFSVLVVAAAFEELVFRGYPLQVLIKGIGPWPAMIAMSCVFGLIHAQNPNSSRLGVFNTIVAGIMLSLAYWKTRSLWLPYGLHLGWNVALGMIAGLPLSGLNVASLWATNVTGSRWLLGGEYGPEGGVLGTLIFLSGAIVVWKIRILKVNDVDRFR